jgi:hypothetical protein
VKTPGPISMFFRECACRIFGHRWRPVHSHGKLDTLSAIKTGRYCTRCLDAEARVYRGQYPVPR